MAFWHFSLNTIIATNEVFRLLPTKIESAILKENYTTDLFYLVYIQNKCLESTHLFGQIEVCWVENIVILFRIPLY